LTGGFSAGLQRLSSKAASMPESAIIGCVICLFALRFSQCLLAKKEIEPAEPFAELVQQSVNADAHTF